MSRSVYSVVLDDDVVEALDRAAVQAGTNRSAMLNRLLASQLEYLTPEERIRGVFDVVERLTRQQQALQIIAGETGAQLFLRSALRYKYNPTVKYSLELYPYSEEYLGVLRVQLRTQNAVLIRCLARFYDVWVQTEQECLGADDELYEISGSRFSRLLRLPQTEYGEEETGERLTRYVLLFDSCLKLFFSHLEDVPRAAAMVRQRYCAEQEREASRF